MLQAEFFADYIRTISQRDITELSRIAERIELPAVLRLIAERTASPLNAAGFAQALGTSEDSMRGYLPLVETDLPLLPGPGVRSQHGGPYQRRPKLHMTDSALWAVPG